MVTNTVIADIATAAITNAIGSAAQAAATGGNIWQAAEKGFVSGGLSAGVSDVAQPLLQEAGLSADAAKQLLQQNQAEQAQQQNQQAAQDPVLQMQQKELALKEKELEDKKFLEIEKLKTQGVIVTPASLRIAENVTLILPLH